MKRITFNRQAVSGFSLLEVLVAVVVLATGLLALAALQSSLARNSADAKARTRVATLLSNHMDEIRAGGYDALVVTDPTGTITTFSADPTADCSDTSTLDAIDATACEAAVNGLKLTQELKEFSAAGGVFANQVPGMPRDAQFKHVVITAEWTDATGALRTIQQATALSALSLQANSPLVSNDPDGFKPMGPKVRQENPFEEGMIPIAIGDGSETAATNPKPVVVGTNNTVVETKFNVFTYREQGSDGTLIQQRIETTVVGCRCSYNNAGQLEGVFTQNFRPTYWSGSRFASPEFLDASRPAPAGPASVDPKINPQSDLCTDCCRDHHDETEDVVKFDPHRQDAHSHYRRDGTMFTLASTGEYNESCRLVRVDGMWRVASDFKVEHVGYVATGPSKSSQAPDPIYAGYYEKFIVDSLRDLFVSTIKDGKTLSERYDDPARLLNDSPLEISPGTSSPPGTDPASSADLIPIEADLADWRYLHTRALLIDHIEPSAKQTIDNAVANCTKTGDAKVECALPHIPFTTINITELARYTESDPDVIDVQDGGVNFNDPLIVQGLVSGRNTADPDDTDLRDFASANAQFRRSNSALAAIQPIEPPANDGMNGDAKLWLPDPTATLPDPQHSDFQLYRAINVGKPLTGEDFLVQLFLNTPTMTDGNQNNDPGVRWSIGGGFLYPCGNTTNATGAVPALCQTDSTLGPGVAPKLVVSGYNYWADSADTTTLTCPNANNKGDYGTVTRAQLGKGRLCRRYAVTSAAVNGAAGRGASLIEVSAFPGSATAGKTEATTIYFDGSDGSHIKPNERVDVTFGHVEDVQPVLQLGTQVGFCHYQNPNSGKVVSVDWLSACDQ
jgi:type IV pilus modification protein PilV